jgi:hypothetical protein
MNFEKIFDAEITVAKTVLNRYTSSLLKEDIEYAKSEMDIDFNRLKTLSVRQMETIEKNIQDDPSSKFLYEKQRETVIDSFRFATKIIKRSWVNYINQRQYSLN